MKLPDVLDLRALIAAHSLAATLKVISAKMQVKAGILGDVQLTDPARAGESIRKLSLEISNALVRAAAECDAEHARRKFADTPDIKLHTPEDDSDFALDL